MGNSKEVCSKHNIEKKKIPLTNIFSCHKCSQEQEEGIKNLQDKIDKKKLQEKINNRIDNALILPRFQDKTIENFKTITDKQKKAKNIALWFLDNLGESTGLILLGNPGTGKNHLATGIVRKSIEDHNKTALITETLKIIRAIKESWRSDSIKESKILKSFIDPDILVIDELGVQFDSNTEKMYLTEIINDRYNYKKPTILIGNLKLSELIELIGDRAIDRFRDGGKVIILDGDSYRKNR